MSYLQEQLLRLVGNGNVKFTQSLHPGVENILGLRVPDVRALARRIAADPDWNTYLNELEHTYMEERMLHGMILGYVKHLPLEVRLQKLRDFVLLINSWSVCDTVCPTLKFVERNKEEVWRFLVPYFHAADEYAVRFAVVMALDYYVEEAYLDRLFTLLDEIAHEGYYVKMAVAWLLSVCFVKYPQQTERYLAANRLDAFTQNKALQKIRESYRVSTADKERLKRYKR